MAIKVANNQSLTAITALPAAVSGGAMTLLETQPASSSSTISFTSGIDSTYDEYVFKFIGIHPSTDGVDFTFQGSTNTGSSYGVTTTHTYFNAYHNEGDTGASLGYEPVADLAQSTGEIELIREEKLSADSDHCGCGYLHLFDPGSTTFVKHFIAVISNNNEDSHAQVNYSGGYFNTTSAIDAIRFKVN